jgi:cobalt-zinc-cadmium efflux system outer membrane protein
MRPISCLAMLLAGVAATVSAAPITFEQAVARLSVEAPALKAADAGRRAAEAGLLDADRRPNPSVEVEVENFAGTRPYRGFDGAEVTAVIEQPIELGGKRRARVAVARAEVALAVAERQSELRRLLAELVRVYGNAAASRARAGIAAEQVRIAETLASQSARRLAVGDISEVEHDRVVVTLGEARTELERTQREAETAERSLASLVGAPEPVQAELSFLTAGADPAQVTIMTADEARLAAITERDRARVAVARSERVPDLAARGGVRMARDEDAVALVAGVSIPLRLFNPGRARVAQAQAEAERASFAAEAQRREARRAAERALGNWRSALRSLETIERQTIPAAERLVSLSERGYRLGALPYRDLGDARTSLYNARRARLDALEQIAESKADLAEVTGAFGQLGLPIGSDLVSAG